MQIPTDCVMNSFRSQSLKKITSCDLEEKDSSMKESQAYQCIAMTKWYTLLRQKSKSQISREKI